MLYAHLALTPAGMPVVGSEQLDEQLLLAQFDLDGGETWSTLGHVDLGADQLLDWVTDLGVGPEGELRVAIEWRHVEWQGDFSPQGSDGLLRYSPTGELEAVELTYEVGARRRPLLIDGSPEVFYRHFDDYSYNPEPPYEPPNLWFFEAVDGGGELLWSLSETEWSVGPGRREYFTIDRVAERVELIGTIDGPDIEGQPLWTAQVDPATGTLTRGCFHAASDPATGDGLTHWIADVVSTPDATLVGAFQYIPGPDNDAQWLWIASLD